MISQVNWIDTVNIAVNWPVCYLLVSLDEDSLVGKRINESKKYETLESYVAYKGPIYVYSEFISHL